MKAKQLPLLDLEEPKQKRHRWEEVGQIKTGLERWDFDVSKARAARCRDCDLVRVSNPKGAAVKWTTYYRNGKRLEGGAGSCKGGT